MLAAGIFETPPIPKSRHRSINQKKGGGGASPLYSLLRYQDRIRVIQSHHSSFKNATSSRSSNMFTTNASTLLRPIVSRATAISRIPSCTCGVATSGGGRRIIHIEKRIEGLGIVLPTAPTPKANYNIVCIPPGENVMYLSGHLPVMVGTILLWGGMYIFLLNSPANRRSSR